MPFLGRTQEITNSAEKSKSEIARKREKLNLMGNEGLSLSYQRASERLKERQSENR
jgi:hypothetical protein